MGWVVGYIVILLLVLAAFLFYGGKKRQCRNHYTGMYVVFPFTNKDGVVDNRQVRRRIIAYDSKTRTITMGKKEDDPI